MDQLGFSVLFCCAFMCVCLLMLEVTCSFVMSYCDVVTFPFEKIPDRCPLSYFVSDGISLFTIVSLFVCFNP